MLLGHLVYVLTHLTSRVQTRGHPWCFWNKINHTFVIVDYCCVTWIKEKLSFKIKNFRSAQRILQNFKFAPLTYCRWGIICILRPLFSYTLSNNMATLTHWQIENWLFIVVGKNCELDGDASRTIERFQNSSTQTYS